MCIQQKTYTTWSCCFDRENPHLLLKTCNLKKSFLLCTHVAHSAGSRFNSLQNEHEKPTEYKFIKYDLPTNVFDENLNNCINPFSAI